MPEKLKSCLKNKKVFRQCVVTYTKRIQVEEATLTNRVPSDLETY